METIRSIAPHCTEAKRRDLESLLLTYRSPFEQTSAGFRSEGRSRFDLLSAIPKGLRSDIAGRHYRELERKFGKPTDEPEVLAAASIVGSPIPPQGTERMTDDQWLHAIKKYQSEFPTHSFLKGGAVELSRELGARTKDDPERFARLALQFPKDAHPAYLDEILCGLKKVAISSTLKIRVCEKAFDQAREYSGSTIADVIGYIEEWLPEKAVEMLGWLATEDDSAPRVQSEDLYAQGINMTRGRAAQALHGLILTDATYIDRFRSVIDRLVRDPSPAVLSCVAGMIAAIWRHDAQVGMHLFDALDFAEDRLLTTPHVDALLRHVVRTNLDVARPLVLRMLQSRDTDVNEAGGRLAGLTALYHEGAGELAEEALGGGIPHRLGIAQVAATNLELSQCREWCEQTLVVLFNDNDATVRMRAAGCFGATGDIPLDQYSDVISQFCESRAFRDHADSLLRALEESPHRLPGLTCDVCQRVLEILSEESGRAYQYRISIVANLVFRTYQHHQHDEWATQALDLIDRLCLEGDGSARRHIEEFER